MIKRALAKKLLSSLKAYPVVAVVGPRQSGKSTLVKTVFPHKPYVSMEDLDMREYAINDPRGFISEYPKGAILDEIQRTPQLFSYLQTAIDKYNKSGMFILTGSQHFLMHENISQTLAGRVRLLKLLPFSLNELSNAKFAFNEYEEYLFKGFYPRIYDKKMNPRDWYPDYIQTYVEKDLRLIKNIGNLNTFQKFLKMCAGRVGQVLNLSGLASDCGITHNTAKSWISLLEASFIVFLLSPHYKNFNKRLIKMPKLYFYDTGLLCCLVGIKNKNGLKNHNLKGEIFESFILSEILKNRFNKGLSSNIYFWRDKTGREIDCIIEKSDRLVPLEIKSGRTMTQDQFKNLIYWNGLSKTSAKNSYIIYGGDLNQKRSSGNLISWRNIKAIL
jgi:predicted AAA+ superfamily ATPase